MKINQRGSLSISKTGSLTSKTEYLSSPRSQYSSLSKRRPRKKTRSTCLRTLFSTLKNLRNHSEKSSLPLLQLKHLCRSKEQLILTTNTKKSDLQNGSKRIRKPMMKRNDLLNGSRSKLKTTMRSLIQGFSIRTMILIKRPNLNTLLGKADTIGQRKLITDLKPGTRGRPLNGWRLNERDAIQKKTTMQSRMRYILKNVTIE